MGTVRREPIETADRGVAGACVRSGISGWVIGLLIGWRAVAERRGQFLVAVVADAGRRRGPPPFSVWDLEIGGGGALRQQPLARNWLQPSDVLALCWILEIGRARPLLKSARKRGPRFTFAPRFLARARAAPRPGFRSGGGGAQLRGLFGASRSKPLTEGWLGRVCALAFQAG